MSISGCHWQLFLDILQLFPIQDSAGTIPPISPFVCGGWRKLFGATTTTATIATTATATAPAISGMMIAQEMFSQEQSLHGRTARVVSQRGFDFCFSSKLVSKQSRDTWVLSEAFLFMIFVLIWGGEVYLYFHRREKVYVILIQDFKTDLSHFSDLLF